MLYKLKIQRFNNPSGNGTFRRVYWHDAPADAYGQKYYLTEDGEFAYLDLRQEPEPEVWQELKAYFEAERKNWGHYVPVSVSDTWRYFADLSLNQKFWYEGHVGSPAGYFNPVDPIETTPLSEDLIHVEKQSLQYTHWLRLSDQQKKDAMHFLFENPAVYNEAIIEHPYHIVNLPQTQIYTFEFPGTTSGFSNDRTARNTWLNTKSTELVAVSTEVFRIDAVLIEPKSFSPDKHPENPRKHRIESLQNSSNEDILSMISFAIDSFETIETIKFELSRGGHNPRAVDVIFNLRLDPHNRLVPECKLRRFELSADTDKLAMQLVSALQLEPK